MTSRSEKYEVETTIDEPLEYGYNLSFLGIQHLPSETNSTKNVNMQIMFLWGIIILGHAFENFDQSEI